MKGIISRMLPVVAPVVESEEDGVEYSFATEYHGPPLTYDLPRAVPIDMRKIPTASVVVSTSLCDDLSLPVVQPILVPDSLNKEHTKEHIICSEPIVSPTSVIAFEHRGTDGPDCGLSSDISSFDTSGILNSQDQSCELSDLTDISGVLGSSSGHECSSELPRRISSSGVSGFFNGKEQSGEIGGSGVLGSSEDCKESLDFQNDIDPLDWVSTESALSSQFLSSAASSFKAGECSNSSLNHAKRPAVVTFRDVELSETDQEDYIPPESEIVVQRKEPELKVKKGLCYRCLKGNRFTEKEVCIVCDAKYCSNCVLRAMGSMPEGRKCVPCIGFPIDESKRKGLGKCSRLLKRLLSELEIRQIMKTEKLCESNQLQAEHVYVNGQRLRHEELILLQSCPNPPSKLKPGRYWYDKVSGFWGKEGQKPCKIISPHLNVGGPILADASCGNTQVFINNREITKVELRMLQLAGVQCAGNPHFWLDEDGSYQEEGQKNMKGNLWSKAGMKLVCAVLKLPIPYKAASPSGEEVSNSVSASGHDYHTRMLQKFLLVGYNGSGTSTIFKQSKILYQAEPFSEDEREKIKLMIQSNVYNYLGILLEGRERFEEEEMSETRRKQLPDQSGATGTDEGDVRTVYSISPRLKSFSDWLLKVMVSGNLEAIFPAATREYAPLVEEMWKDSAVQATFKRRSELQMLPSNASYFLERVVDISRADYEPSNQDILHAEGITSSNGLACMDFSFPQSVQDDSITSANQHEQLLRYQLIKLQSRGLGENCKWLEMFEDVGIAIFCVSLSDYDQFFDDGTGTLTNKMLASRRLFESIVTHPVFEELDFLLILNKFDQLEEKIEKVPLTQCEWFNDFCPVTSIYLPNGDRTSSNSTAATLAQLAFHYIAVKFKRHFTSLTGRKLYVSMANGLESESVDRTLRYAREILKWEEERVNFSASEFSIYSTEVSSSP